VIASLSIVVPGAPPLQENRIDEVTCENVRTSDEKTPRAWETVIRRPLPTPVAAAAVSVPRTSSMTLTRGFARGRKSAGITVVALRLHLICCQLTRPRPTWPDRASSRR
jgi:hypothetical protein